MSRAVTIYSVPGAPLSTVVGSRDAKLKRALGGDPEQVAAAGQLLDGVELTQTPAAIIHGFELLCAHWGRALPSNSLSPTSTDLLERFEGELVARRAPLRIYRLIMGGGPLGLPWADDFPTVGHAPPDVVAAMAQYLAAHPLDSNDALLSDFFADLTDWVAVARPRGDTLVGFWY